MRNGRAGVSLQESIEAVLAANSAVWHAIAGFRYMWEAYEESAPFEIIIDRDLIATKPFPGLGVSWTYKVYPERLREHAQEVVRHATRQAIVDVSSAIWGYGVSAGLRSTFSQNSSVVLLRALRNAYSHRSDSWHFDKSTRLPLQWRNIDLVPGMHGKTISQTIFLNEQLLLLNDAIHLLDPNNPLVASVHR